MLRMFTTSAILLLISTCSALQIDVFVGEIKIWPMPQAPLGWAFCDGSLLPILTNPTLYAQIGTRYGGDGVNNFALPDLRGRVPRGVGTGTGLTSVTLAQRGGAESSVAQGPVSSSFTLQANNIPPHSHTASFAGKQSTSAFTSTLDVSTALGLGVPQNGGMIAQAPPSGTTSASIFLPPPGSLPPVVTLNGGKGTVTTTPQGDITVDNSAGPAQPVTVSANAALPVNVVEPYLGLNYIIATAGIIAQLTV